MVTIRQISLLVLVLLFVISFAYADDSYGNCIADCDDNHTDCIGLVIPSETYLCDNNRTTCHNDCSVFNSGEDEDGDGVSDEDDSLIGDNSSIYLEGISNLDFTIGGFDSTDPQASVLTGIQNVNISTGSIPLIEMEVDFDDANIDVSSLEIKLQDDGKKHGIVVKGLVSNDSSITKTIFLERTDVDASVCAVDREIDDISEVSKYCDGQDEYFFGDCDSGETIGSVSCSIENDMFKISGLKHSGAVQLSFSGLYTGYYTVVYRNTASNHRDGYLMPGEAIEICMEPARPILEDEYLRFSFLPQHGLITVNEFYTPLPMMEYNVHIYP